MIIEQKINYMGFGYTYRISMNSNDNCILILGGALQRIASWDRFFDIYKEQFDVLVCDLPGMGDSDVLPSTYPMEFLVDCLKHLLDELKINEVMIQSSSYGTPVAYLFSEKHPEKISKIIMAGTMSQIPESLKDSTSQSIYYIYKNELDKAAELFVHMFMNVDNIELINNGHVTRKLLMRSVTKMSEHNRLNYIQNTKRLLNSPRLTYSNPPRKSFLIFTGEYDLYTSPARCWDVAMNLPVVSFTTIKNADHLINLEQFDTCIQICSTFFSGGDLTCIPKLSNIKHMTV
ncbi:alpha/beta fold hydrolase [Enterobacter bugandensis]